MIFTIFPAVETSFPPFGLELVLFPAGAVLSLYFTWTKCLSSRIPSGTCVIELDHLNGINFVIFLTSSSLTKIVYMWNTKTLTDLVILFLTIVYVTTCLFLKLWSSISLLVVHHRYFSGQPVNCWYDPFPEVLCNKRN